jgi:hypothetical protein
MDECLKYFRAAISEPLSVPPWSEWWAANVDAVERAFPLVDYVRLKHRKLLGARQILQFAGELPVDYRPPSPRATGSCGECGERTAFTETPTGGEVTCPTCGVVETVV